MDGLSRGTPSWGQRPAACGTHASSITRGFWPAGWGSCTSGQHVPSEATKWALSASPCSAPFPARVGGCMARLHLPPSASRTLARYHVALPAVAERILVAWLQEG